jgi:methyltransferase (TIGR00027 family)
VPVSHEAPSPEGIGETAIGAAMMRARETVRPAGLFSDPYAAAFVAAAPPVFEDGPDIEDDPELAALEAAFEDAVVVRTRFFDDFGADATRDSCTQVVLVGAGLDTRAFRLDWPDGLRLFELDSPEVLGFKDRVLSTERATPRCRRIAVPADLEQSGWPASLIDGGFDPSGQTAWIAEGVMPYLRNDAAERLLVSIGRLSSTGSRLALDHAGGATDSLLSQAQAMPSMKPIADMWKGGLADDVARWLAEEGWDAQTVQGESLAARYGRGRSAGLQGVFVTAQRA